MHHLKEACIMAKIDFKENGSKGVESSKNGAQEAKGPIIIGAFSPARALLQMVDKFGDQLSKEDLLNLDADQWYTSSFAEQWSEVTKNLSTFIADDHRKHDEGELCIGAYGITDQATPNLLLLISRAFEDIDCLIRLKEVTQERMDKLSGEQA
jgi:hypothetical protein